MEYSVGNFSIKIATNVEKIAKVYEPKNQMSIVSR